MRRVLAGVVPVAAVLAVTSAVGAHASRTSVVDRTYSCKVRAPHYVDLEATVTLPPTQGNPRPASLNLFTVDKTFSRNGFKFNLPQLIFEATKDSLKLDGSTCRPSSRRVALEATGLPSRGQTVTPNYLGTLAQRCVTSRRVLVHFRIDQPSGAPAHALVALADDNPHRNPVAFLDWKPQRIKGHFGKSCVSNGTG